MKFNLKAENIIKKEIPIVDRSETLINCVSLIGNNSICLVMENGNFRGILGQEEILQGFMNGEHHIGRLVRNIER